jgi:hypothetical protein
MCRAAEISQGLPVRHKGSNSSYSIGFTETPAPTREAGMCSAGEAGSTCLPSPSGADTTAGHTQTRWLEAALGCGLPLTSFLIVEWSLRGERHRQRRE